jgi:hypothetical protein
MAEVTLTLLGENMRRMMEQLRDLTVNPDYS